MHQQNHRCTSVYIYVILCAWKNIIPNIWDLALFIYICKRSFHAYTEPPNSFLEWAIYYGYFSEHFIHTSLIRCANLSARFICSNRTVRSKVYELFIITDIDKLPSKEAMLTYILCLSALLPCCTLSNFLIFVKHVSKQMCLKWFSCFQSCSLQSTEHPATCVMFLKRGSNPNVD